MLLISNDVVAGGITGLAVIGRLVTDLPFAMFLILLNLPLLVIQWKFLGGMQIFLRTLVGVLTSLLIQKNSDKKYKFLSISVPSGRWCD